MKRRILRNVGMLLAAASTAGCAILTPLPKPVALKERLSSFPVKGLPIEAPVAIYWDEHQIPFIEAETDNDAAFALGLVHAHLRLGQMSIARMLARGRVSEMAGPLTVDIDRGLRTLAYARANPGIIDRMDPDTLRWLQRFVDGINHYQGTAEQVPHEFPVLGLKREPWSVEDVLAVGRLAGTDVNWLVWAGLLPLRDRPDWPSLWARLVETGGASAPSFSGGGLSADAEQMLSGAGRFGSNSMALSSTRTATDGALIANDPHLGILVPNFWLIAGLKSPTYHVVGLMGSGVPVFAIGRTPNIAWGGTHMRAASSDLLDISALQESRITKRRERISVRWWFDTEVAVRETPYGPILSDVPLLAERGLPPAALRWTGHEASDEIGAMLAVSRARNFGEFRDAFRDFAVPGQNMLYADREGNIGQLMAVRIPSRAGPPADLLVDPDAAEAAWRDMRSVEDLPFSLNPDRGFLVSANNRPAGVEVPVGFFFSQDDRVERMAELIEAGTPVSVEELKKWQQDVFMQSAVRLRDAFLDRMESLGLPSTADETRGEVVRRLRDWDGHYRRESQGAVVFEQFRAGFAQAFYTARYGEEDGPPIAAGGRLSDFILEDIDTADEAALRVALAEGLRTAAEGLGSYENWGAMHRLTLAHPLSMAPLIGGRYQFAEHEVGGSTDTLMKTSHERTAGAHTVRYGANARHVSDMSDPDANYFVLLGGQDGWLSSSTLLDQWSLWRDGRYVQVPLSPDAVRAAFPHRLDLER